MTLSLIKDTLLWCLALNYALLVCWVAIVAFAHDGLYRLSARWFRVEPGQFNAIQFAGIAGYKIAIILLILIPWIALHLTT